MNTEEQLIEFQKETIESSLNIARRIVKLLEQGKAASCKGPASILMDNLAEIYLAELIIKGEL